MQPRCSTKCCEEIKQHMADKALLIRKLAEMTADRNEWREQHENLLAMYQAAVAAKHPASETRFQ